MAPMGDGLDKNGRAFVSLLGIATAIFVAGAGVVMFLGKDARAANPGGVGLATAEQVQVLDHKIDRFVERYEERLRKIEDEQLVAKARSADTSNAGYRK